MKYAPANEDGYKPYVVVVWHFGQERERLVWAADRSQAKYDAVGGRTNRAMTYAVGAWRATPHDVERLT